MTVFAFLEWLEKLLAYSIGKGFGTLSCESEVKRARKLIAREDFSLVIDVGGNVGNYTEAILSRSPSAEVVIFEPSQFNVKQLSDRFNKKNNVRVVSRALGEKSGQATLYSDLPGSGLASLLERDLRHIDTVLAPSEEISVIDFESFWKSELQERPIDLIKLDVEGFELGVLKGCGAALAVCSVIQFEFGGANLDSRTTMRDFFNFFRERGFTLFRNAPFGIVPVTQYTEMLESYRTTNYFAVAAEKK